MNNNISLFGWDTVYGISYTKINNAIKTLKATPINFKSKCSEDAGTPNKTQIFIEGTWGNWQLTTNSDGKIVKFKCPIESGEVTIKKKGFNGSFSFINKTNLNWIEIEFNLEYIVKQQLDYVDSTSKEKTGQQQDLLINTKNKNVYGSIVGKSNNKFYFEDKNTNKILNQDCNEAISQNCIPLFLNWFDENLDKFAFIFSKVIINQVAYKGEFQWLKPTSVSYAVSSGKDSDTSIFGVMAMTENRVNSDIDKNNINANLLTIGDGHSVFAINSTIFLKKWILPGLLSIFPGTKEDDYTLDDNNLFYTNKNQINWITFKDEHNNNVPAIIGINGVKLSIKNNRIKFDINNLHWEVEPGVTVYVNYSEEYEVSLKSGTDKQGNPYKNVLTVYPIGFKSDVDTNTSLMSSSDEGPKLYMSFATSDATKHLETFIDVGASIVQSFIPSSIVGLSDKIKSAIKDRVTAANNSEGNIVNINLFNVAAVSNKDIGDASLSQLNNDLKVGITD